MRQQNQHTTVELRRRPRLDSVSSSPANLLNKNRTTTTTFGTTTLPLTPLVHALIGFIVAFSIFTLTYSPWLHPGSGTNDPKYNVDPLTCKPGCWDRRSKYNYPSCTRGMGQTVRGVKIPRGQQTCYKQIYYNLEFNTMLLVLWSFGWLYSVCRMVERVVHVWWKGRLRVAMLCAFVSNFVGFWYSFNVIFHYLNDNEYNFFWAQVFFTVLEFGSTFVVVWHMDVGVHSWLSLSWCQGSSMFQMFELVLDERTFGNAFGARNIAFMVGDAVVLLCVLRELYANYRDRVVKEEEKEELLPQGYGSSCWTWCWTWWNTCKVGFAMFAFNLVLFQYFDNSQSRMVVVVEGGLNRTILEQ